MIDEIEQRSPAWYEARAGHITASRIKDVLTNPRKGQKDSTVRQAYMGQLICERLIGKSLEEERGNFYDIKRGNDMESQVRVEYDLRKGVAVDTAGFVKHPTLPMAGCSPDGYVGKDGMVQLKAPRRHIHINWLRHAVVPSEHKDQMLFELACHPDRKWSDFVSYIEELPYNLQLFVVRQTRDEARIAVIEAAVVKFNLEIEQVIAELPRADGRTGLQDQLEASLKFVQARNQELVDAR